MRCAPARHGLHAITICSALVALAPTAAAFDVEEARKALTLALDEKVRLVDDALAPNNHPRTGNQYWMVPLEAQEIGWYEVQHLCAADYDRYQGRQAKYHFRVVHRSVSQRRFFEFERLTLSEIRQGDRAVIVFDVRSRFSEHSFDFNFKPASRIEHPEETKSRFVAEIPVEIPHDHFVEVDSVRTLTNYFASGEPGPKEVAVDFIARKPNAFNLALHLLVDDEEHCVYSTPVVIVDNEKPLNLVVDRPWITKLGPNSKQLSSSAWDLRNEVVAVHVGERIIWARAGRCDHNVDDDRIRIVVDTEPFEPKADPVLDLIPWKNH
jgi:hypothetical protein